MGIFWWTILCEEGRKGDTFDDGGLFDIKLKQGKAYKKKIKEEEGKKKKKKPWILEHIHKSACVMKTKFPLYF